MSWRTKRKIMDMNIILIAGHGGMIDDVYQTPGKRSPVWPDGRQYFEGKGNREIVEKLHRLCQSHAIDSIILIPEQEDIKLSERVKRANKVYATRKDSIIVEIHSNGASDESAHGFEIFTSKGETKSDGIVKIFHREYLEVMDDIKDRGIKEANFYVIKRSNCPAVLIETMFHTNQKECNILFDEQDRVVEGIFNGILALRAEQNMN